MIKNPGYISIFYQPGQGKARLRPSSTSFPIARQPNTANAQARKGVRFCLRTTLQEVCWILGGGTSALFFKSQLSERQKAASSGFWKMVLAESRRLRSSRRKDSPESQAIPHKVRSPGSHTENGYPHKPGSTPPKKHKPSNAAPAPGSPSLHQEKNYRQHHHR